MAKSRQVREHGKQASKATRIKRREKRIANRKATHNTFALSPAPDDLELGKTAQAKKTHIFVASSEPKEIVDKLVEQGLEVTVVKPDTPPISAARKAFQDK